MQIYLLDMGAKMYGDCILVVAGDVRLLIDGAHPGDNRPGGAAATIQDQLASILHEQPPFALDLLVVTHCHSDHIGCLPELYSAGLIKPRRALVADEKLGFGRARDEDAAPLSDEPIVAMVAAALREEPRANARSDADLAQFLEDAVTLEARYGSLLRSMEQDGVKVVRYGPGDHEPLLAEVAIAGLSVLGPSDDQLIVCAEAIAKFTTDAVERVNAVRATDATLDAISLYRLLAGGNPAPADVATDAPGKGAALNDQSILVIVGEGSDKCLLAGDMQFAAPETPHVDPYMIELRAKVRDAAPYAFVKIPHHGSYNAVNDAVLAEWQTNALGITTGSGDPGHPSRSTLDLLKRNRTRVKWVRTDKNGLTRIDVANGAVTMTPSRGGLNDSSANGGDALAEASRIELTGTSVAEGGDHVEVTARIPNRPSKVVITVEIAATVETAAPAQPMPQPQVTFRTGDRPAAPFKLAPGRQLPPLLFVSNLAALANKIGPEATRAAASSVRDAGQDLVDIGGTADPLAQVHGAAQGKTGIVLLGGYDVVPSYRFDVLPADLRARIGVGSEDNDDFIVWSDQPYAAIGADGMAELPVSRIPDGGSADLVRAAFAAPSSNRPAARLGVRNSARPFAEPVFTEIAGTEPLKVCGPTRSNQFPGSEAAAHAVYIMLHGSDADATAFWGETAEGAMLEGFSVGNVPSSTGAVVFAGCCWGALTVAERANRAGSHLTPRTAQDSIALAFLAAGAHAFVGCTGTHYSPSGGQPDIFGGPMHTAFWTQIGGGSSPAKALFDAKLDYIEGMPHGRTRPSELAIEYKILRQFTCLGLGW